MGGILTFTDLDVGVVCWIIENDGTTSGPYVRDAQGNWTLVPESDLDAAKWKLEWDTDNAEISRND